MAVMVDGWKLAKSLLSGKDASWAGGFILSA
jgi:hypothetical protein